MIVVVLHHLLMWPSSRIQCRISYIHLISYIHVISYIVTLKKPLRRIEIEEIDSTDIKRKISDMSATTRAQQSAEKKKIEARDSDMFSKFTDRLRDDSANDSKQTTPVPTIQSPADICQPPPSAKRSSHSEGINNQTKKNTPETSTSPVAPASPRAPVSPRAPANSFQFQRDWKEVKSDLDSTYNYLKVSLNFELGEDVERSQTIYGCICFSVFPHLRTPNCLVNRWKRSY